MERLDPGSTDGHQEEASESEGATSTRLQSKGEDSVDEQVVFVEQQNYDRSLWSPQQSLRKIVRLD